MKITNDPKASLNPLGGERSVDPKSRARTDAAGSGDTEASATVELSAAAATLSSTDASAEFDAEKVERISQAIREGKYVINAEVIADKLIANAQELLGKASH
jgi:negative regulator of flagellin synthesis FlgM